MKFRFANEEDAAPFAQWAIDNLDIPREDIEAAKKENNPTSTVLIITDDAGIPVLYVPAYCALRIAYLGFNPEATDRDRIEAMNLMLVALKGFAATFGINEIGTLSRKGYSVARWAEKHDFQADERQLFTAKVKEVEVKGVL